MSAVSRWYNVVSGRDTLNNECRYYQKFYEKNERYFTAEIAEVAEVKGSE